MNLNPQTIQTLSDGLWLIVMALSAYWTIKHLGEIPTNSENHG